MNKANREKTARKQIRQTEKKTEIYKTTIRPITDIQCGKKADTIKIQSLLKTQKMKILQKVTIQKSRDTTLRSEEIRMRREIEEINH